MIMYSLSHPLFNGLLADGYLAKLNGSFVDRAKAELAGRPG